MSFSTSNFRPNTRSALRRLALVASIFFGFSGSAVAAPEVDVHDITWFVHIDLINVGAGEDLAYWTGVIEGSVAQGNNLLVGRNGPADQVCCTEMTNSIAVTTFGTPGDGLDVIDTLGEQNILGATGGSGSRAFLVDSLTYCNGSSPSAIGCATLPSCSGNPNDDPNLWMYVSVEAYDDGTLPSVIAHERGHNACLPHVAAAKCQLMQGTVFTPGLGGCLTASECTNFRNARTETSSGRSCGCHDDFEMPLADGALCDALGGVCSGGRCGQITGDAGVHLISSADPGDSGLLAPEDALRISALTGDWTNLGQISPTAQDVRGLAYAHDSSTLYGIVPTIGDDSVVTIDETTGAILSTVGTIANGSDEFVSLAYDPGATSSPGDDRLIGLQVTTSDTGQLRSIDPASPNSSTFMGSLGFTPASSFSGLAYDSAGGNLFFATPFWNSMPSVTGLWMLDLSGCPPSCVPSQVSGNGRPEFFWDNGSLAYSPDSGMLYAVGTSFPGANERTFYNVIDPVTLTSLETLSVDRFTPAGLAAVPEPGVTTGVLVGVLVLSAGGRRRFRYPHFRLISGASVFAVRIFRNRVERKEEVGISPCASAAW